MTIAFYGLTKPWGYFIVAALFSWTIIVPVIGIIFYFLEKSMTVGVLEQGGRSPASSSRAASSSG